MKNNFNPEDLKKYWKGKYNNWKCALNSKKEWICSNGKISGRIVTKIKEDKIEYPDLEIRKLVPTGGIGLNIWGTAFKTSLKSFTKSLKSNSSSAGEMPHCPKCGREYAESHKTCNYCDIELI